MKAAEPMSQRPQETTVSLSVRLAASTDEVAALVVGALVVGALVVAALVVGAVVVADVGGALAGVGPFEGVGVAGV